MAVLRKRQNLLPRETLKNIYKAFVRPFLDFIFVNDVIFDQAFSDLFRKRLETIQATLSSH